MEINEQIKKIVNDVIKEFKDKLVLKEYYDSAQYNGIKICVFGNDRADFTPHIHIFDGKDPRNVNTFHIEVSLLNLEIINVKFPRNIECDWSNFRWVKKALDDYMKKNRKHILTLWFYRNQDNPYKDEVLNVIMSEYKELEDENVAKKLFKV